MKKLLPLLVILMACMLYGQPMQGPYTIGNAEADFTDLNAAIQAIHTNGATDDIYFYLLPGTYTGPYLIDQLNLQGNSLLISSGSYSSAEVVFTNHAATSQDNYIINIKNSSNIIIDDLDFAPTGSFARCILVSGDSNNLTFQNNRFFGSGTSTSNNELIYFISESANDADNILIQFNQFFGGSYHVVVNAISSLNNFNTWTIQANIHTGGFHGIALQRCSNVTIESNTMIDVNKGISLTSNSGTLLIKRNRLDAWASGIDINGYSTNTTPSTPNIYNNIIRVSGNNWYGGSGSVEATGLTLSNSQNIYAAHNSVALSSSHSQSYVASINGTRNIFRKNHFVNLGGGYSLNFTNTAPGVTNRNLVEFNNLYASSTNLGRSSNTYFRDINEMIPLFDSFNADFNPFFEDAHLRTSAPRLNNLGPYAGVDEDFFGNPRSSTDPDIGAHEYDIDLFDPLLAPMEGSYTIGIGGDYITVNSFARDLAFRGINNPITAYLSEAIYDEQVIFDRIPGSG
ncbi:MAG: hypothetical protein U1C33_05210, partial [Candidatus Cloacimonadaceae bacterium]|nr:hypothetical protein [Candidatus Cloacimonadaceae bacterium]